MPPRVIATQERMVFSVLSDEPPKPGKEPKRYRVDLLANGGTVQCSCSNWGFEIWPNIKAGKRILDREERTLCKHGLEALIEFDRDVLPRMAKEYEQQS